MQYSAGDLKALLKDLGGSVYIVDTAKFGHNVSRFLDAFCSHYPNTKLGYSYKTNYLPVLASEADRLGHYAEVVSGDEYKIARSYGVSHRRIIFNGPVKTEPELETALLNDATVNIDSLDEVAAVQRVCERNADSQISVGVRCHLPLGDDHRSRFGLSCHDGQLDAAVRKLSQIPNCTVAGLSCHSSAVRNVESYRTRTELLLQLADRYFPDAPPRFLDIGGGFCGPMPALLSEQVGTAPTYREYAEQIAPLVASRYGADGMTELILEPGVGVLADAVQFVCEIVSIKSVPQRRLAVATGSCQNIRPTIDRISLPMSVLYASDRNGLSDSTVTDIVGYTCMEDDVLYYDYTGSLEVGDIAVFDNVGAYSIVFKSPFIRGMPAIVCRDDHGGWQVLHRRQPLASWLTETRKAGNLD